MAGARSSYDIEVTVLETKLKALFSAVISFVYILPRFFFVESFWGLIDQSAYFMRHTCIKTFD